MTSEERTRAAMRPIASARLLKGKASIAEHLGLSPYQVLQLWRNKDLPLGRVGREYIASPEQLDRWIAEKLFGDG